MDKPLKLAHLIISILGLLVVIVGAWVSINREQADHEARIKALENQGINLNIKIDALSVSFNAKTDRILDKLDETNKMIYNKK